MNISVFGLGYVGTVCLGCFAELGHKLIGVDIDINKINQINRGESPIIERRIDEMINSHVIKENIVATEDLKYAVTNTEMSIICVGTPNGDNGSLNISAVENVIIKIGNAIIDKFEFHTIVIRSTVPPGSIKHLEKMIEQESGKIAREDFGLVMNPEFLREGSAVSDFMNPPFVLIGSECTNALNQVKVIYKNIKAKKLVTSLEIAEMIKFVNNSYHALKIAFANEIGNICYGLNIDSDKLMDVFVEDKVLNISKKYFKPGFAYGGSCLPKDLMGINSIAQGLQIPTPVLNNIEKSNNFQIKRLTNLIKQQKCSSVGFLGIAFKSGTDDLRNSPIIEVMKSLINKNYKIKAYDVNVNINLLKGSNLEYIKVNLVNLDKILAKSIPEVCSYSEIIIITNYEEQYFSYKHLYEGKIVIDLTKKLNENKQLYNYLSIN